MRENGIMKCDFCNGDHGEFYTSTGNHVACQSLNDKLDRIDRLEAALKPFAKKAAYAPEYADTFCIDDVDIEFNITLGDLRRAAEALREKP